MKNYECHSFFFCGTKTSMNQLNIKIIVEINGLNYHDYVINIFSNEQYEGFPCGQFYKLSKYISPFELSHGKNKSHCLYLNIRRANI